MAISIGSAADLAKIGVEESHPLNGDYLVTNDFALSGQWTPIAPVVMDNGWPILDYKFTGTFDGNGKTISGLFIEDLTDGACCKALFGCIWGGVVKRLKLRGSVTLKNEEGGGMYVGGLACVLGGGGIIEENDIGVDVTGFAYVAPICPYILSGGSIINNKTSGTVTATVVASGVCCGIGDFEGTKDVAYIAKNVFVGTMNFTGNDPANYGVGMICFPPELADAQIYFASDRCYWDYELSPYTNSYVGEHKTTAELKQQATFIHWNFDSVWKIDAGEYPDLQCFVNAVVPDVEGMTQAAAVAAIEAVGLVVSTATAYNADFASGLVCQQLPAAETTVALGSTVDIVISAGPEYFEVPGVLGLDLIEAASLIEAKGFVVSATTEYNPDFINGLVCEQNPDAGVSAMIGSTVEITISLGHEDCIVPEVVGETQDVAIELIESAELSVNLTSVYDDTVPIGVVISQNPVSGTSVSWNSDVDIEVSLGVEYVTIPDVVDMTKTEAMTALQDLGLLVDFKYDYSELVEEDDVISQDKEPGLLVATGTLVTLTISSGTAIAGMNSVAVDTRSILLDSGFDESGTWSIFVGHEPAKPDLAVTVYDQEGILTQSHNRTLWHTDRIQIRVRGLTYDETYAKMLSIQKYLILKQPFQYEGSDYKGFVAFGTPYYLGLDEQKRMTWSLNFGVHREEITDG